jgi:hypothetical protein
MSISIVSDPAQLAVVGPLLADLETALKELVS